MGVGGGAWRLGSVSGMREESGVAGAQARPRAWEEERGREPRPGVLRVRGDGASEEMKQKLVE